MRWLLILQSIDRIDLGGTLGRDVAREKAGANRENSDGSKSPVIGRGNARDEAGEETRGDVAGDETQKRAQRDETKTLGKNETQNIRALSA